MKERVKKMEETFDLVGLYNQVYDVEKQNESLEAIVENLTIINKGQKKAALTARKDG